MQETIKQAFVNAKDSGAKDGADPDAIINQLSADIASAVHDYVTSITVMINPGIPVATAGTPALPLLKSIKRNFCLCPPPM